MDTEWNEEALEKERTSLNEMRDRMGREDGTWMVGRYGGGPTLGKFRKRKLDLTRNLDWGNILEKRRRIHE